MSANKAPIFGKEGILAHITMAAGDPGLARNDGVGDTAVGPTMYLLLAGGPNGSWLDKVRFLPSGNAAARATAATIYTLYASSVGAGAHLTTDTVQVDNVAAPVQTTHATIPVYGLDIACGFIIPANEYMLVSSWAAIAANTWIHVVAFGSIY